MSVSTTPPPIRQRRGCFFYGCLTGIVLLIIAGLAVFFTIRFVRGQINAYTSDSPAKLPTVEMSDEEFQVLKQRTQTFGQALEEGKAIEPLVLSERDVNALLLLTPEGKEWADKVYVSLEGDEVKGQVSIPLEKVGRWFKGRYLNGEATFNVSLENNQLIINTRNVQVNGKPLPEYIMADLRKENLAKEAARDPENAATIRKLESIRVEDGRVIVTARNPVN